MSSQKGKKSTLYYLTLFMLAKENRRQLVLHIHLSFLLASSTRVVLGRSTLGVTERIVSALGTQIKVSHCCPYHRVSLIAVPIRASTWLGKNLSKDGSTIQQRHGEYLQFLSSLTLFTYIQYLKAMVMLPSMGIFAFSMGSWTAGMLRANSTCSAVCCIGMALS